MILLFVLCILELLWCISDLLIKPRMITYEKGFQREVRCRKFDEKSYHSRIKNIFHIKSEYGYILSCEMIENENNHDKKIAVLCHGLGYARYGSIKYMELFLKLGFSVLMYDHRNHGQSGKALTSMGYYECYDLKKVIDWCYETYGNDCKIVTHGESMGAATVLMHLGIDQRVKCAIADCPFSDLKLLLKHQLKQYYHLPRYLIPVVGCLTFVRAGFWFKQVSPLHVVCQTDTPVLFIHGKIDSFVPAYMSRQMYLLKKKNKAIYLVARARHAESICVNREGYEQRVRHFLNVFFDRAIE